MHIKQGTFQNIYDMIVLQLKVQLQYFVLFYQLYCFRFQFVFFPRSSDPNDWTLIFATNVGLSLMLMSYFIFCIFVAQENQIKME